jgi:FAD dependent monooxygenase
MTPNFGQGGNSAIEGVAVLVNELHKLLKEHPQPTCQQIGQAFCGYKDKHEKRAMKIFKEAKAATRQQALDGFFNTLIALFGPRLVGEAFILRKMSSVLDDSPTLDFIHKL